MVRAIMGGLLATVLLAGKAEPLERAGRLAAPAIREASGMVASRRHPGIFWVHNDSGNPPELFAVRRDGTLVQSYKVAVPNVDWEDISTDDSGHLYLADTGNNHLALPIRVIHTLAEPDPASPPPGRPLLALGSNYYKLAAKQRFDAEGVVFAGDRFLIVTKRRDGKPAEVFRLPVMPAGSLFRPATPERVTLLPGCNEPVTGAALSPDRQTLAVVTNSSVRVYRSADLISWEPIGETRFDARDVEAITWDGNDLILASEDRSIYRVPPSRWRAVSPARR